MKHQSDEYIQMTKEFRRHIHAHPELSMKEYQTHKYIFDTLTAEGFDEIYTLAGTGLVAVLRGESDHSILIRADIDALPVPEKTELVFQSQNDHIHHACVLQYLSQGHDGHTAMLLAAATYSIRKTKSGAKLPVSVKFCFQPGEEGANGALQMINDIEKYNLLDSSPKVQNCFGLHIMSFYPTGQILYKTGPITAESGHFTIEVHGKGGHAMQPEVTIDAIQILGLLMQQIYALRNKIVDAGTISIGSVNSGKTYNIIEAYAKMMGTIRTTTQSDQKLVVSQLRLICESMEISHNCKIDCNIILDSYQAVENHPTLENKMMNLFHTVVNPKDVIFIDGASLGGEDFCEFSKRRPSAYFGIGACLNDKLLNTHHSPVFDFDESVLAIGFQVWVNLIFGN